MLLKFIPICSKSLLNFLLKVYLEVLYYVLINTITISLMRTHSYYINTNEKPGKLLLKNMI